MINFENTEIAFKSKSNSALNKSYLLFKILGNKPLTAIGEFFTKFALLIKFPVKWAIKPTIYKQFVGGESISECEKIVFELGQFNVKSILDFSVEGKDSESEIQNAMNETLRSIEFAKINKNIPFAVFKPSGFISSKLLEKSGSAEQLTELEKIEFDKFETRINILCEAAFNADIKILIDAEETYFQNSIDSVVEKMMLKYNKDKAVVYNTIQMYRCFRLDYLKKLHSKACNENFKVGAKFVRGAYMENERALAEKQGRPSPIHASKEDTDKSFNDALEYSIKNINEISIFCGTHNELSSNLLVKLLNENNIEKTDNRIWFSQLYGMSDHISFNLANLGYNVAKYVPYGPVKYVMPYLFRRAKENTSAGKQAGRELSLIIKEQNRRRNLKK